MKPSPLDHSGLRTLGLALALMASVASLSACAPLIVGGAALGGAMVASDRRSSGTILDDQTIEMRAANRIRELVGAREHINVHSYNHTLLLTGEVHNEEDRKVLEEALRKVEGVKEVFNETVVAWPSSFSERSKDELVKSKVSARLLAAKSLAAGAFNVICERGVVYLMGRVTEEEATRATELASEVEGAEKVVRVLEIISPDQLPKKSTPASSSRVPL